MGSILQQALSARWEQLRTSLSLRNRGSVFVTTSSDRDGNFEALITVYDGMMPDELTSRELRQGNSSVELHPSFNSMILDGDHKYARVLHHADCESFPIYEGGSPGSVTISGFGEEYRMQQNVVFPRPEIATWKSSSKPPKPALEKIVNRIRLLQQKPHLEDNKGLREILGISGWSSWRSDFLTNRKKQITKIETALNRGLHDKTCRFVDFSSGIHYVSSSLHVEVAPSNKLENFLLQMLLGSDLLVRRLKDPDLDSGDDRRLTKALCSQMVLSDLWSKRVNIQDPARVDARNTYSFFPVEHIQQVEGIIHFAELLSWPYLDEVRGWLDNVYEEQLAAGGSVPLEVIDWMFGLVLPGRIFRYRIMSTLVSASPSLQSLEQPPFFESGLVVRDRSYWPQRTVLGRVLGALDGAKSVCGWVGPVPAPDGDISGWVLVSARAVEISVGKSATRMSMASLGLGQEYDFNDTESSLAGLADPHEWIQAAGPTSITLPYRSADIPASPASPALPGSPTHPNGPQPSTASSAALKSINLVEVPQSAAARKSSSLDLTPIPQSYRCTLTFTLSPSQGPSASSPALPPPSSMPTEVTYSLNSNPLFITAPPCVGTHYLHRHQATQYLSSFIRVSALKDARVTEDALVLIDAMGEGEEAVARAWCAERGKHAVIRRGEQEEASGETCFACAVAVASQRTGVGVGVLIWCR